MRSGWTSLQLFKTSWKLKPYWKLLKLQQIHRNGASRQVKMICADLLSWGNFPELLHIGRERNRRLLESSSMPGILALLQEEQGRLRMKLIHMGVSRRYSTTTIPSIHRCICRFYLTRSFNTIYCTQHACLLYEDAGGVPTRVSPYKPKSEEYTVLANYTYELNPSNDKRPLRDGAWVKEWWGKLRQYLSLAYTNFNRSGMMTPKGEAETEWMSDNEVNRWNFHVSE